MKHNKYNDSDSEFNENMDDELELELDIEDEFEDDYDLSDDSEFQKTKKTRRRTKSTDEYYVKGAELIAEIKKYHESKRKDAEARRCFL